MESKETWLDRQTLAKALFCTDRAIQTLKADGTFCGGVHYYAVGNGLKSGGKHVYCLELCREALLLRTAKKAKNKAKAAELKPAETFDINHLGELVSARA